MLLIKLKNNKIHRNIIKNPTIIFHKNSKIKIFKKLLKKKNIFSFKKLSILNTLLVNKNKITATPIVTDTKTYRLEKGVHQDIISVPNYFCFFKKDRYNFFWEKFIFLADYKYLGSVYTHIYNIVNGDFVYTNASGNFVELYSLNTDKQYIKLILPSKKLKKISIFTLGKLGRGIGIFKEQQRLGLFKNSAKRQTTRGIAMNPVDHPNGGRANTKKPFLNKYGKIAKHNK